VERRIVRGGVELSRFVLGTGNFGGIGSAPEFFGQGESQEQAFAIMDAAWAAGITAFDTADAYGGGRSERAIGAWMRERRRRPVLTTKTYNPMAAGADRGLAADRIDRQLRSSLERLGVDWVDLYLAHDFDPETPLEETIAAFESLRGGGLVRAWGVSNFTADQLRATCAIAPPALIQNSYSLLDREDERDVIPFCRAHGIAYEAFSPLAGGWLSGKYRRDEPLPPGSRMTQRPGPYRHLENERVFAGLERLAAFARERSVDSATIALSWLLAQETVGAIVLGPRRPEHLGTAVNARALALTRTDAAEVARLFE
jgi:aryl-alcohol dehydrogenase-like predicted oxidoreductase